MALKLSKIYKSYGDKKVTAGLSVLFPEQGTIALLGPSGCGKTTLLRLITGLEKPDSGLVEMPEDARMAYVFQEDRLLPALTASGNIMATLNCSEQAGRILAREWLARVGLEGEENTYPDQLSGGMKRRVAIARALAFGGDFLFLDEPFKGLDREMKGRMQDLVLTGFDARLRLNILVTHDVDEALYTANKILLLGGPPLVIKDIVSVDIPIEKRRESEDILIWHREYILRKM
jgi:NitT/TauT family transport system ATP-binding protein